MIFKLILLWQSDADAQNSLFGEGMGIDGSYLVFGAFILYGLISFVAVGVIDRIKKRKNKK